MPWRDARDVQFSRIGVVSTVPSEGGVFGVRSEDRFVLISETWNLKARLLELINALGAPENLSVVYELCPEAERSSRVELLTRESLEQQDSPGHPARGLPGLRFWASQRPSLDSPPQADGLDS